LIKKSAPAIAKSAMIALPKAVPADRPTSCSAVKDRRVVLVDRSAQIRKRQEDMLSRKRHLIQARRSSLAPQHPSSVAMEKRNKNGGLTIPRSPKLATKLRALKLTGTAINK
jgi:hypothetical protein